MLSKYAAYTISKIMLMAKVKLSEHPNNAHIIKMMRTTKKAVRRDHLESRFLLCNVDLLPPFDLKFIHVRNYILLASVSHAMVLCGLFAT